MKKIFYFKLVSQKGITFETGDEDVPEVCKEILEIKPDEYVLGFFGNMSEALDGFGIYCAKVPIVERHVVTALTEEREKVFDPNIEGTTASLIKLELVYSVP